MTTEVPSRPSPAPAPGGQPSRMDVLAIVGFVLAFTVWPAGLVVSIIAVRRSAGSPGTGRGLAIAGAVISALALVLTVVGVVLWLAFANR